MVGSAITLDFVEDLNFLIEQGLREEISKEANYAESTVMDFTRISQVGHFNIASKFSTLVKIVHDRAFAIRQKMSSIASDVLSFSSAQLIEMGELMQKIEETTKEISSRQEALNNKIDIRDSLNEQLNQLLKRGIDDENA